MSDAVKWVAACAGSLLPINVIPWCVSISVDMTTGTLVMISNPDHRQCWSLATWSRLQGDFMLLLLLVSWKFLQDTFYMLSVSFWQILHLRCCWDLWKCIFKIHSLQALEILQDSRLAASEAVFFTSTSEPKLMPVVTCICSYRTSKVCRPETRQTNFGVFPEFLFFTAEEPKNQKVVDVFWPFIKDILGRGVHFGSHFCSIWWCCWHFWRHDANRCGQMWTDMSIPWLMWTDANTLGSMWTDVNTLGLIWLMRTDVNTLGLMWTDVNSAGLIWTNVNTPGLMWTDVKTLGLMWTL